MINYIFKEIEKDNLTPLLASAASVLLQEVHALLSIAALSLSIVYTFYKFKQDTKNKK